MSDTHDSIAVLEEAVQRLPTHAPLRRQLVDELLAAGRAADAFAHVEVLLGQRPDDAPTLAAAARCLVELGRAEEARERYERAVALDVAQSDAALRDKIMRAVGGDPRARIRLVQGGAADPPKEAPAPSPPPGEERVTFADVGGLDELKEKIRLRILYPLTRPELYKAFGKKVGGGLLFYGPPGCGKTFLARATAGEAKLHFVAVGVEDVLDMWLGQSEKKLHELFQQAKKRAPAVLFFDEVDALGGRRSHLKHESYRTLVTQFLSELDGAGGATEGVLVMGATNAPWDVDSAFRRPGRFGEVLFVPPPDLRARVEILKLKLKGRPQAEIDCLEVARKTELYSGADLSEVVERATEQALGESMRTGKVRPLTTGDLLAALARVRPSTREWFAAAKNFATYANEGGQYDDVLEYIRAAKL